MTCENSKIRRDYLSMDRISSLLTTVLNRRGLTVHAEGALAVLRASKYIEKQLPQIFAFIHVRNVKDGQMVIACENAIAMQECHALTDSLVQELKNDPSCGIIHTIRVERV